jgi:hypothetical protein
MSWLQPGDRNLHHSDWSHRHTGGPGTPDGDERYAKRMAAHLALHRAGVVEAQVSQGVHRFEDYPA